MYKNLSSNQTRQQFWCHTMGNASTKMIIMFLYCLLLFLQVFKGIVLNRNIKIMDKKAILYTTNIDYRKHEEQ